MCVPHAPRVALKRTPCTTRKRNKTTHGTRKHDDAWRTNNNKKDRIDCAAAAIRGERGRAGARASGGALTRCSSAAAADGRWHVCTSSLRAVVVYDSARGCASTFGWLVRSLWRLGCCGQAAQRATHTTQHGAPCGATQSSRMQERRECNELDGEELRQMGSMLVKRVALIRRGCRVGWSRRASIQPRLLLTNAWWCYETRQRHFVNDGVVE
jgi:hypothetical protein